VDRSTSVAHSSAANLAHATLIEANLAGAVLAKADLSDSRLGKADLRGADLRGAKLVNADLTDARLDAAFVCGTDLRHVRRLTQQQIDRAFGDRRTSLPAHLARPATWLLEHGRGRARASEREANALVNAYTVLEVEPGASMREVRLAWRRLVKQLHPDTGLDDPSADERLKAINRAYQSLKRLELREMASRAQCTGSGGVRATFAIFLVLPIAATLAVGIWTRDYSPAATHEAALQEQQVGPEDPAVAVALGQPLDTDETRRTLAARPAWSKVGALPSSPERSDNTPDDDATWARATAEATSVSLHRYLGRYPQGRHAQKAVDELAQAASVEVALGKDFQTQDTAAIQLVVPILRRYLEEHPTGHLAQEVRGKLAVLGAVAPADVAWSGAEYRDANNTPTEQLDTHAGRLAEADAHQALASGEVAQRERALDGSAGPDAQRGNTNEVVAASQEVRREGRQPDKAGATIAEEPVEYKPRTTAVRQGGRPSSSAAHSVARWPVADEPSMGADGRIR
jgi:DnaJ-domain-containing protein 1